MAKNWPCKKINLSIMNPLPERTKFVSSCSGSKTVGSQHHTGFGCSLSGYPKSACPSKACGADHHMSSPERFPSHGS